MYKILLLVLLLIFFLPDIKGQESTLPNDKLIYGVYLNQYPDSNSYYAEGLDFNTVVQYVNPASHNITGILPPHFEKAIPLNSNQQDYIYHYSGGYYKRWEAEEDIDVNNEGLISGMKHQFGEVQSTSDGGYWIVSEDDEPGDNFIYGPHYSQDKSYRAFWYMGVEPTNYILKYRIKLLETSGVNQPVCRLKLVFKYRNLDNGLLETYDFPNERIVYSNELSTSGFTDIQLTYSYPDIYVPDPANNYMMKYSDADINYNDAEEGTGIQFIVDWLGGLRIAVDYIEVYDEAIWGDYIDFPGQVISDIISYAESLPDLTNLWSWHSHDAPLTIDGYEPYRVIDFLLEDIQARPLITDFHPGWDGLKNGRKSIQMWKEVAKPKQLYLEYLPMWYIDTPVPHQNIEWLFGDLLRERFQEAHIAMPDYYFLAPVMEFRFAPGDPYYRKPIGSELRAMVMLSLAHGVKGIFYMHYYSYESGNPPYLRCLGLVDLNFEPTDLWEYIHDNISPRITGTLGNTLIQIEYTGNYIHTTYQEGIPPRGTPPSYDYLSIEHYGMSYDWHAGFLHKKNLPDNKYFLLTNLRTAFPVTAKLEITNNTQYNNVSFRDVEGGVDITIGYNSSITHYTTIQEGDGKLYQVAPVVKYGGTLTADETAGDGMILNDDMIIDNGATLSVFENYYAKGNIIIENGTIENMEGGKIIFQDGKKLIITGNANISGTINDKLILDFYEPDNGNGIVIEPGGH